MDASGSGRRDDDAHCRPWRGGASLMPRIGRRRRPPPSRPAPSVLGGVMTTPTPLDRGRTAYREHRYADAVAGLDEADREHAVEASDLEHLAIAAILLGRFEEGLDTLTRAHEAYLAEDDVDAAARCAAWLGMELMGL